MADIDVEAKTSATDLYERDFTAWAERQAALMAARRYNELDVPNLVEEIESLGNEQYFALQSALTIVLLHLLKWDHQPGHRSRSWKLSVVEHRQRVLRRLMRSPGLKARLPEAIAEAYDDACARAEVETGLDRAVFPLRCPYDWDAIMTRDIVL